MCKLEINIAYIFLLTGKTWPAIYSITVAQNKERRSSMDEFIGIKLPVEKKEQLQKLAEKLGLNISGLVRMIIFERLEKE